MAITHSQALSYYAKNNIQCETRVGLTKRRYNCYNKENINTIYKYFKEIYAIKDIINDIVRIIDNGENLTVEKVETIYNKYKNDIRYRKPNIEKILKHLKMQEARPPEVEAPSEVEEAPPPEKEALPVGGRKRRSRKREIKKRGRKSRKH